MHIYICTHMVMKQLMSVARNSTLFADGCKSWSAAHRGRVLHVSHSKNQFVLRYLRSEDCNRILGTQLLDRNRGKPENRGASPNTEPKAC